jgi:deoxyribonuclease-4
MSGKGTEIGGKFEDLKRIIDKVNIKEKVGICLDTCHIWDAGYDLENNLDGVLEEFDNLIGLKYLKAIHLNNSLNICGSHKDRHANLYNGKMSENTIKNILIHEKLKDIPFYLETPIDNSNFYIQDLDFIKKIIK